MYGRLFGVGVDLLRYPGTNPNTLGGSWFGTFLVLFFMAGGAVLVMVHAFCFVGWYRRSRADWTGILVAAATLCCALLFGGGRLLWGVLVLPFLFFTTESSGFEEGVRMWMSNGMVAVGWGAIAVLSLAQCFAGWADLRWRRERDLE